MNSKAAAFLANVPPVWGQFCNHFNLTSEQQEKFAHFGSMLLSWNELHNLTAITDIGTVIGDHFYDSLSITKFVDFTTLKGSADVGTGGGFPGIPLKIMYPHLPMVLIEVNEKKIAFLSEVIDELQLPNIVISDLDWRTFLRKTSYDIDLFCARASLRPDELTRAFSDACPYKNARIVYWASQHWKLDGKEQKFFEREEEYDVLEKKRKLIFFVKSPLQT